MTDLRTTKTIAAQQQRKRKAAMLQEDEETAAATKQPPSMQRLQNEVTTPTENFFQQLRKAKDENLSLELENRYLHETIDQHSSEMESALVGLSCFISLQQQHAATTKTTAIPTKKQSGIENIESKGNGDVDDDGEVFETEQNDYTDESSHHDNNDNEDDEDDGRQTPILTGTPPPIITSESSSRPCQEEDFWRLKEENKSLWEENDYLIQKYKRDMGKVLAVLNEQMLGQQSERKAIKQRFLEQERALEKETKYSRYLRAKYKRDISKLESILQQTMSASQRRIEELEAKLAETGR